MISQQMRKQDIVPLLEQLREKGTMLMKTKEPQKFKEALSRWKEKQNMSGRLFFEVEGYEFPENGDQICILMVTYNTET